MCMNILVAGINGFVGKHLTKELHKQAHSIIGCGLDDALDSSLRQLPIKYYGNTDLTNSESISKLPLSAIDAVINLAGLAQVGKSFGNKEAYERVNVEVHTKLIDELLKVNPSTRIVSVSTGAVYDNDQQMPLAEDSMLTQSGSPYAQSKILMEEAMAKLAEQGADIVIARPFNHIGPGQLPGFLLPDLANQLLKSDEIEVGNLATERDYTDVRDVVKAYTLLATQPTLGHFIYNICSGTSIKGSVILDKLAISMKKPNYKVMIDKSKIRPNDPEKVIGDNSRIKADTGWHPTIPLEQTIDDFVKALKP